MKTQTILIYIIIAYFGMLSFAYLFSDRMMFYPPKSTYKDTNQIIKLHTASGDIISAIYLPHQNSKYVLLVSHGNAEDLGHILPILKEFNTLGFSVFSYDYQGYGTSTGKPSEKNSYAAINAAYQYLNKTLKITPNRIILFGNSIGAAVSIDLAIRKPVAALILQSPFLTAFRVVTRIPLIPFDKFNNLKKIKKIHVPILIIHGKRDRIVPFWQGKRLYEAANKPKEHLWIKDAGHNTIPWNGNIYKTAIKNFVNNDV